MAKAENFHESYRSGDVKPPSERSTGLVFAAVALILAGVWRHAPVAPWVAVAVSAVLLAVSLVAPRLLRPVNILWFRLGLLLHRIVNPIVMLALFVVVFVPAGLLLRLWRDPLRTRRTETGGTYWIDRKPDDGIVASMKNQF